jgi:hypothetical protein
MNSVLILKKCSNYIGEIRAIRVLCTETHSQMLASGDLSKDSKRGIRFLPLGILLILGSVLAAYSGYRMFSSSPSKPVAPNPIA